MLQWKSARGTRKMYNQKNWPWPYSMHKSLFSIVSKEPISLYLMNFVSPFSMINDFDIENSLTGLYPGLQRRKKKNGRCWSCPGGGGERGQPQCPSTSVQCQTPHIPTSPHYRPYNRLSVVMKHSASTSYWWTASRLDIWRLTFDKYKFYIGNILINRYDMKYENDTRLRSHSIYFLWNKNNRIFPTVLVDKSLHLITL